MAIFEDSRLLAMDKSSLAGITLLLVSVPVSVLVSQLLTENHR
jgi:hypothetical protein